MAGSLNRVTLIGNVGADPEIRQTQQGVSIANFSIATSETWKDRETGEKKERTEWHRVVVFDRQEDAGLAGIVEKYVRKGSKILVEGQMKTRKWQDQSGQDRYSTEVVLQGFDAKLLLLDKKEGGSRPPAPNSEDDYGSTSTRSTPPERPQAGGGEFGGNDDIPFEMSWR